MPTSSTRPLAYLFLRTLRIFQALAAIPILVALGLGAMTQFFDTFETVYNLIRSMLVALMASAIIFIVLIQHSLSTEHTSKHLTMISEMAKSALATGMWLWLMLDSVLNNTNNYRFFDRSVRMQASGFVAVVLFVLFYPSMVFAVLEYRHDRHSSKEGDTSCDLERNVTPLVDI